ncbi:hypothetical protein APA_4136 [Pseudanabaena sp. lw0831]|nr:hypothetical protein APA_4136 [Pseudanabaena sp. lw0831]
MFYRFIGDRITRSLLYLNIIIAAFSNSAIALQDRRSQYTSNQVGCVSVA